MPCHLTNGTADAHSCHMTSTTTAIAEVRFTAKRALIWNNGNHRWQNIGREKAQALVAAGLAVELKEGEWI